MKKPFVIGLAGALFGLVTAFFVILTATSGDMTLSGVQAALFSSLGMGGAAISKKETRFAGWMLLSSALWITLSVPVAGTLHLLYLYAPAILLLGIAALLCFKEPEKVPVTENEEEGS
jgi:RsiW-degrading membrane proteinase PrsW (M82 family)